jgi:hypothetical protein
MLGTSIFIHYYKAINNEKFKIKEVPVTKILIENKEKNKRRSST